MSASDTLDMTGIVSHDQIALELSRKYNQWKVDKNRNEAESKDLRNSLYATDTSTTVNRINPFYNRTTIPKLMQIAQNLHANYSEHMFSSQDWFSWEAHDHESSLEQKRTSIESYIKTKARMSGLVQTFSDMLWDWIIYGNCYGELTYVNETTKDPLTGDDIQGYVGPKLARLSPFDVCYNAAATSFRQAPKFVRYVYSMGDLQRMADERPDLGWSQELVNDVAETRMNYKNMSLEFSNSDIDKSDGFTADGFSTISEYYESDLIEVLVFLGDFYNGETKELMRNQKIVVVDRRRLVSMEPQQSWTGSDYMYHDGWAARPDNLYGMGPLDNLVGMQYKIDKLENLRADVFDQIAHATTVEVGNVEYFGQRGAPGGRYVVDDGGSVQNLAPDATALNADTQIQQTMVDMEQLAGSPREAMGIRSPGEKTAFEVQTLDNAANRLFRHKVNQFETNVVEPVLNDMLEMARRNLNGSDLIRSVDSQFGIEDFLEITKEDLTATGKLYALGSKHFIANANMMQNLNTVFASPLAQFIAPHISKIELAKAVEGLLGIQEFSLVHENIGVMEDVETARIAQTGEAMLQEENATDPGESLEPGVDQEVVPEEEALPV